MFKLNLKQFQITPLYESIVISNQKLIILKVVRI